jgi:hypothetical protein
MKCILSTCVNAQPLVAWPYSCQPHAIDLLLDPDATKASVVKAIEGHMLAEAQLMGRYKDHRQHLR